jgi:hypothetical protein
VRTNALRRAAHDDAWRRRKASGVAKIGRGVASRQGGFFNRLGCLIAVAARADAASEGLRSTGRPCCAGRVRKVLQESGRRGHGAGDVRRHPKDARHAPEARLDPGGSERAAGGGSKLAATAGRGGGAHGAARVRTACPQSDARPSAHARRFDPGPSEPTWNPQPNGRGEPLGREYRTNPKPAGNLTDATIGADAPPGQQPNGRGELLGREYRANPKPAES